MTSELQFMTARELAQRDPLYVIVVETGEYSDRRDWIGGIYRDKATAERILQEKSAEAREHNARYDAWLRKQWATRGRFTREENALGDPRIIEAIKNEAGPEPTGQRGDRFYLVEVPQNKWGEYVFAGDGLWTGAALAQAAQPPQ